MMDNERRFNVTFCPVVAAGIGDGAGSGDPRNLGALVHGHIRQFLPNASV